MMTAVLMPITSPVEDTSGPPELPGLSGASVCTTSSIIRPVRDCSERPSAETTPAVTVASKPSGLPMAIAIWPRLSFALSPSRCGQRDVGFDPEERKIRVGIVAEYARLKLAAFERREIDRPGALDDMAVGKREAVGGNDDAGAEPALRPCLRTSMRTTLGPTRSTTSLTTRE